MLLSRILLMINNFQKEFSHYSNNIIKYKYNCEYQLPKLSETIYFNVIQIHLINEHTYRVPEDYTVGQKS